MILFGNIAASLIAFRALIAFLNGVLGPVLVGLPRILSLFPVRVPYVWIFCPLAAIIGVPCVSSCPEGDYGAVSW